jgi:hypothetical protein
LDVTERQPRDSTACHRGTSWRASSRWLLGAAIILCSASAAAQPPPEPSAGGAGGAPPDGGGAGAAASGDNDGAAAQPGEPPHDAVTDVDKPKQPWPDADAPAPAAPARPTPAAAEEAEAPDIAGYDGGFFLRSPDGSFALMLNGRIKFRFSYLAFDADDVEDEFFFSVPRVRIALSGHAFTEDFTYRIQVGWDSGHPGLKDGYLDYRFVERYLQLRVGQFKKPFSRQRLTSDGALVFVERSITDRAQAAGRDIGVMLHNGQSKAPMVEYSLGLFNGSGDEALLEGDIFNNAPDQFDPLLAWRLGVRLGKMDAYDEIDFEGKGVRFAVALDGQARFNADENGDGFVYPGLDYMFKAHGFTSHGRLFLQWQQAPAGKFADQGYAGLGFHVEANYLVRGRVAPMFRYAQLIPNDAGVTHEILGGLGGYVFEHDLQAQVDGGALLTEADGGTQTDGLFRVQLQGAF